MSSTQILMAALTVLIVLAVAVGTWYLLRSHNLRRRFGPEYERVIVDSPTWWAGVQRLRSRQRRHQALNLHELSPEARSRFSEEWREVQTQFVDAPATAVIQANELVNRVIAEQGYPGGGFEQQAADLSVNHARTLPDYRDAYDVASRAAAGKATTEELRSAMVHYRALVTDLLNDDSHHAVEGKAHAS